MLRIKSVREIYSFEMFKKNHWDVWILSFLHSFKLPADYLLSKQSKNLQTD